MFELRNEEAEHDAGESTCWQALPNVSSVHTPAELRAKAKSNGGRPATQRVSLVRQPQPGLRHWLPFKKSVLRICCKFRKRFRHRWHLLILIQMGMTQELLLPWSLPEDPFSELLEDFDHTASMELFGDFEQPTAACSDLGSNDAAPVPTSSEENNQVSDEHRPAAHKAVKAKEQAKELNRRAQKRHRDKQKVGRMLCFPCGNVTA